MQGAARSFFTLAIIYLLLAIILGLKMAISNDHGEMVTHAHIMLVGWVTSAIVVYFYHMFPAVGGKAMATYHFWFYAVSTVIMLTSLLLLYGGTPAAEPGAGVGSIGFALSMLYFAYVALRTVWKS